MVIGRKQNEKGLSNYVRCNCDSYSWEDACLSTTIQLEYCATIRGGHMIMNSTLNIIIALVMITMIIKILMNVINHGGYALSSSSN